MAAAGIHELSCNSGVTPIRKGLASMKAPQCLFVFVTIATAFAPAKDLSDGDNILSTAVRLRLQSIAPVVIDPEALDLQTLMAELNVDATQRSVAVSQLKAALEPRGFSVVDHADNVWITKKEFELDLSRQIALVVNTADYRQLATALRSEERRNPDPRLRKLAEMATFMAEQSVLPAQTRKYIEDKAKKIKSLQYMQKNALSGSSLSPPDPARARSLELDLEQQRADVRRYFDSIEDRFNASNFNPEEPSTAPPPIFGILDSVPEVVYNRIALDSQLFFVESLEILLRASTELAFDGETDRQRAEEQRAKIDSIKKARAVNKNLLGEYMDLLGRAGLLSSGSSQNGVVQNTLGVDAANRLFNDFGDGREAVRQAIGKNIMGQFEAIAREFQAGRSSLSASDGNSELYLYGNKEIALAAAEFGQQGSFAAYSPARHERVGAVTGLNVYGDTIGKTATWSIQLEPRPKSAPSSERSLQNIFGSKDEIVAVNTKADIALFGGTLLGKGGAYNTTANAYFGADGVIASVGEALGLIKSQYDPALFKSKVILGLDQNYDISQGGDSAGVAIALAALSRIRSKAVDSRLMVSGAVRQFGDVRPVGGVYLKGKAALDAGALVLLMPVSNLGEVFNLPTDKILSRHVLTLSRFKDAASIACLDVTEESKVVLEAICLYNFAVSAARAGKLPQAAYLCRSAAENYPDHISAQLLKALLLAAGVSADPASSGQNLADQAKAFANIFATNPVAIKDGSTENVSSSTSGLMAAIIPDYTVSAANGEEAFDVLNDKVKIAFGQPANITVRTRNEYFTNQFINLSLQNKTFEEILKELCDLCDAEFQRKPNAIVIDSTKSPVSAELATTVIPEFTVEDMNGEQAFKYLADRAKEVSGKRPNFVIKSKADFFSELSINLSLSNQTFGAILKQLLDICNAKVEQRGDSYFITVVE